MVWMPSECFWGRRKKWLCVVAGVLVVSVSSPIPVFSNSLRSHNESQIAVLAPSSPFDQSKSWMEKYFQKRGILMSSQDCMRLIPILVGLNRAKNPKDFAAALGQYETNLRKMGLTVRGNGLQEDARLRGYGAKYIDIQFQGQNGRLYFIGGYEKLVRDWKDKKPPMDGSRPGNIDVLDKEQDIMALSDPLLAGTWFALERFEKGSEGEGRLAVHKDIFSDLSETLHADHAQDGKLGHASTLSGVFKHHVHLGIGENTWLEVGVENGKIELKNLAAGSVLKLEPGRVFHIGSSQDNDLSITDADERIGRKRSISRFNTAVCVTPKEDGTFQLDVGDLNSTNGTRVVYRSDPALMDRARAGGTREQSDPDLDLNVRVGGNRKGGWVRGIFTGSVWLKIGDSFFEIKPHEKGFVKVNRYSSREGSSEGTQAEKAAGEFFRMGSDADCDVHIKGDGNVEAIHAVVRVTPKEKKQFELELGDNLSNAGSQIMYRSPLTAFGKPYRGQDGDLPVARKTSSGLYKLLQETSGPEIPVFNIVPDRTGQWYRYKVLRNPFSDPTLPLAAGGEDIVEKYRETLESVINEYQGDRAKGVPPPLFRFARDWAEYSKNEPEKLARYFNAATMAEFKLYLARRFQRDGTVPYDTVAEFIKKQVERALGFGSLRRAGATALERKERTKRQAWLADHHPSKVVLASQVKDRRDWDNPRVMIVEDSCYVAPLPYFRPDLGDYGLEKFLLARWEDRVFVFRISRESTLEGAQVHQWSNCEQVSMENYPLWLEGDAWDELSPRLCVQLDSLLYSRKMEEVRFGTDQWTAKWPSQGLIAGALKGEVILPTLEKPPSVGERVGTAVSGALSRFFGSNARVQESL